MPRIEIMLILGLALVVISGLISAKLKHDNGKKWLQKMVVANSNLRKSFCSLYSFCNLGND